MRNPLLLLCLLALSFHPLLGEEEGSWSWGNKEEKPAEKLEERHLGPSSGFEQFLAEEAIDADQLSINETQVEDLIQEILASQRQGRNLQGYDEVYTDPDVQDAFQKGDDSEARNVIKERLCTLGLVQCDSVDGKRPYLSPDDLVYAQPVALKPVGRPIATIPVRGPPRGYGQQKPVPFPPRPQNSFGPPSPQNSFGPPNSFGQQNSFGPRPIPSIPPRRGYTPQFKPPSAYLNQQNTFTSSSSSFASKPIGPIYHPEPIENDQPYKFEGISAQNSKPYGVIAGVNGVNGGLQQHVHHHFHHGENGQVKVPIAGPIPTSHVTTAALASTNVLGSQSGFSAVNSLGVNGGLNSFSPSSPYGNGLGTYANNVKPVVENYQPQTFDVDSSYNTNKYGSNSFGATVGQFGNTSPFYKKELNLSPQYNLNSVQSQYGQSASYADKFQSFQTGQASNYDCVCVPFDQCPAQNVIGRKDDLYLPLDPRSLKTNILAEDSNVNATQVNGEKNKTDDIKKITKRDINESDAGNITEKANVEPRRQYSDNYGNNGNGEGFLGKKILPTLGVSFGLPQYGGGYPLNPFSVNPAVNPYGNVLGGGGINLGLLSVNPLVSFQVTKNEEGEKIFKPFVNLHVTPNDFLVHKVGSFLHGKKEALHHHLHHHAYPPPPYYPHRPPYYPPGPPFHHKPYYPPPPPIQPEVPVLEATIHEGPVHPPFNGPPFPPGPSFPPGPPFADHPPPPFYRDRPAPASHRLPHYFTQDDFSSPSSDSYFDDTATNYGGGFSGGDFGSFSRVLTNSSNPIKFNSVIDEYQKRYEHQGDFYRPADTVSFGSGNRGTTRGGKSFNFPPDGRSDRTNLITFDKISKRQAFYNGFGQQQQSTCGPRHVCCRKPTRPQVPNLGASHLRQCGVRHQQGINGRVKNPSFVDGDSEFGEYPWQVAILKKDPKESVYVCGGTLIDASHIITAAHCVKMYNGFDLRVRLGEWDVNHDVEFYPYIERDITAVHVHPQFYAGTLYNDLAILRMDKPVDWTKSPHITPACLPEPFTDYTGVRCWTTGWGKDGWGEHGKYQNILKEVDVPIMGQEQCQAQLKQTRLGYDFKLHPGFICAGGEEGKDACKGDGGGPMVCEHRGAWQVVGVVSWGIGCGQYGVPGVYVRVAHYRDWINQVVSTY